MRDVSGGSSNSCCCDAWLLVRLPLVATVTRHKHSRRAPPAGQAEFVRVPIADVNLLKIPETMDDRNAICLADIACTAW